MKKYKFFEFIAFYFALIILLILSLNLTQDSRFTQEQTQDSTNQNNITLPRTTPQHNTILPPPNSHILDTHILERQNHLQTSPTSQNSPFFQTSHTSPHKSEITLSNTAKSSHSSSIVDLGEKLMIVYFAGSKEGASDVKIMQHFIDKQTLDFSPQREILSAKTLSFMSQKFIKKLGNPVIFKDSKGDIHFFVVGVSLGGWATSRIYQLKFSSDLEHLEFKNELQLGLLANFSHLIRTPAIMLENGGFMLPIYHELARKYPLVAFFDNEANLTHTRRLNYLKNQLQPTIIALNESECLAFFRNHKAYKNTSFLQKCKNGGYTWDAPQTSNLKSYDDSYVLLGYKAQNKHRILLLYNDGKRLENAVSVGNSRSRLSLYFLVDFENLKEKDSMIFKKSTALKNEADSASLNKNEADSAILKNNADSANLKNNNANSTLLADSAILQNYNANPTNLDNSAIVKGKNHFAFLANIDSVSEKYPSEVSYPSAIVGDCGQNATRCIFIAYTHNRKNIKLKKLDLSPIEAKIQYLENSFDFVESLQDSAKNSNDLAKSNFINCSTKNGDLIYDSTKIKSTSDSVKNNDDFIISDSNGKFTSDSAKNGDSIKNSDSAKSDSTKHANSAKFYKNLKG